MFESLLLSPSVSGDSVLTTTSSPEERAANYHWLEHEGDTEAGDQVEEKKTVKGEDSLWASVPLPCQRSSFVGSSLQPLSRDRAKRRPMRPSVVRVIAALMAAHTCSPRALPPGHFTFDL